MASSIVFGTIGSGKTYYLVRYVKKYHAKYDNVVSNFPINIPGVKVYQWNDENSSDWIDSGINNTLYVLDEAWALWNSRDYDTFTSDIQQWFALSRHYNNHILLATQAITRLDKIIRELSQDFVFVHSWKFWFLPGKWRRPLFIHAEHYDHIVENSGKSGINQPTCDPIRREIFPFRMGIAKYYDTHLQPPVNFGSREPFDVTKMPLWGRN